ncbi:MAG: zinc ribbon domain-containing protein [Lachnospiraceae bacterium]|nr:zinc ribbon domain-containing protein [Candidatus Colinaster equi]
MYCVKCGNELEEGNKFCTKCGAAIGKSNEISAKKDVSDKGNFAGDSADFEKAKRGISGAAIAVLIVLGVAIAAVLALITFRFCSYGTIFGGHDDEEIAVDVDEESTDVESETEEDVSEVDADKEKKPLNTSGTEFVYETPDSIPDDSFIVKKYDDDGEEIKLLVSLEYYEGSDEYLDTEYTSAVMVVRNKSDKTVDYFGSVCGYDVNGKEIGTTSFSFPAIAPGETRGDGLKFYETTGIDELAICNEYCSVGTDNMTASRDLEYETAVTDEDNIVRVVNNLDSVISGSLFIAYYDENDKPIMNDTLLYIDMLPKSEGVQKTKKKSGYKKAIMFPNFVSYERRTVDDYLEPEQTITQKDFIYKDEKGAGWYFLVVKNISSECINLDINMVVRNKDGVLQDTVNNFLYNLAPDEEILIQKILYCDIDGCDVSTVYAITNRGDISNSYHINDISVETTKEEGSVKVRCTNNGTQECSKCAIRLIYFDKDNNVVGSESTLNHFDVAAGESVEDDVAAPEQYDHFEAYFSEY